MHNGSGWKKILSEKDFAFCNVGADNIVWSKGIFQDFLEQKRRAVLKWKGCCYTLTFVNNKSCVVISFHFSKKTKSTQRKSRNAAFGYTKQVNFCRGILENRLRKETGYTFKSGKCKFDLACERKNWMDNSILWQKRRPHFFYVFKFAKWSRNIEMPKTHQLTKLSHLLVWERACALVLFWECTIAAKANIFVFVWPRGLFW